MKQLTRYAHPTLDRPQHCPFLPNPITYDKDTQAPTSIDDSPLLDNASKKCIQQAIGSFVYYARPLPLNKPIQLRTPGSKSTNSLTICGLIPMQRSATAPPI